VKSKAADAGKGAGDTGEPSATAKSNPAEAGHDVKGAKSKSAAHPTTPENSIELKSLQEGQDFTLELVVQSEGSATVKAKLIMPSSWFHSVGRTVNRNKSCKS